MSTAWLRWGFACTLGFTLAAAPVLPSFAQSLNPEFGLQSDMPVDSDDFIRATDLVTPQARPLPRPASPAAGVQDGVIKAGVSVEKEFVPDITFGEVKTLGKGEKLTLTVMDMVASGYSESGDDFHARVKTAVMRDGLILIPKGSLVKGHVFMTKDAGKSFAKSGSITLTFDYLLMPDGRKISMKTDYTKGDTKAKATGRAIASGVGGALVGAVHGVVSGLKFGGLLAASASHGASLALGGGLGAVAGLGSGLSRSGDNVLLNEGDEIQVVLQESLNLPTMAYAPDTQNELRAEGLDLKIAGVHLERDPFKVENQMRLDVRMANHTPYTFGSFDVALQDEYGNVFQVSPFGGDNDVFSFRTQPGGTMNAPLVFSVKAPEVRHYLIVYKPYTRDVIAKVSVTEALKTQTHVVEGGAAANITRGRIR